MRSIAKLMKDWQFTGPNGGRLDMDEMVRPMVAGGAHITDFLLK